jgi:hypothetical protein
MKFFRKRLVYGIGQTRGFTGQQLRDAKACSDVFHSDVFHFGNDELNGIFKIVCEPACWIFPQGTSHASATVCTHSANRQNF